MHCLKWFIVMFCLLTSWGILLNFVMKACFTQSTKHSDNMTRNMSGTSSYKWSTNIQLKDVLPLLKWRTNVNTSLMRNHFINIFLKLWSECSKFQECVYDRFEFPLTQCCVTCHEHSTLIRSCIEIYVAGLNVYVQ